PFEITGLASSSDGQSAEPVLRVANLDGVVTALCLRFDDMVQAKVTVLDTFGQYLDARTFPDGNPSADPGQYFRQVFYIDSKAAEDNEVVEFRLSSPMDLQGLLIPTRQIT
ncbi:phage minor tail protein L, partial [Cronobacter sakazakii]